MKLGVTLKAAMLILAFCAISQANPISQPTGKLKGVLLDPHEARVIFASIIIEGRNFRRELAPNDEGDFQLELPAGVYRITVNSGGLRRFRRRNVKVESGSTKTIKIILRPAPGPDYSKCKGICL